MDRSGVCLRSGKISARCGVYALLLQGMGERMIRKNWNKRNKRFILLTKFVTCMIVRASSRVMLFHYVYRLYFQNINDNICWNDKMQLR